MAWPTRTFPDEWQQTRITFCTKNINLAYELTSVLPYACVPLLEQTPGDSAAVMTE